MTILRLQEIQHAVRAILKTRQQDLEDDVFIYVDDSLLYAFYHAQDTEVMTACEERVMRALLSAD